jgi:hypothetical protein
VAEVKFFWEEPIPVSLIASSWETAFKRRFNELEWRWRFENQSGDSNIYASYMLEEGQVTCFAAHSPIAAYTPDKTKLRAAEILMIFTHPTFQGKGLYVQMSPKINSRLESLGFDFIYGFANNNSHYTYRKNLNWQDIGILTNFTLNTEHSRILPDKSSLKVLDLPITTDLLKQISMFPVCRDKNHFDRSSGFLTWRVLQHPSKNYQTVGIFQDSIIQAVVIYKKYNINEIDIMEIFWANENDIFTQPVYSALVSFFIMQGDSRINIWSNLYSDEHLHLEKIGFKEDKFSAYFGLINLSNKPVSTRISEWHYRFVDSDVY